MDIRRSDYTIQSYYCVVPEPFTLIRVPITNSLILYKPQVSLRVGGFEFQCLGFQLRLSAPEGFVVKSYGVKCFGCRVPRFAGVGCCTPKASEGLIA